jgi:WD40 repeat protein
MKSVFSPDGSRLAFFTHGLPGSVPSGEITIVDVATMTILGRLEGHGSKVSDVTFSPDGKRLASFAPGNRIRDIRVWDLETYREVLRLNDGPFIDHLTFSRDGQQLIGTRSMRTISESIVVWNGTPRSRKTED